MELDKEIDFFSIFNIKDRQKFLAVARAAEKHILKQSNAFFAFRLAWELDSRGFSTKRLENHIIALNDPRTLYKFAAIIKRARVSKLQEALIKANNAIWLAHFGCFVRGANRKHIERLIIESGNAKAAYLYLRFVRDCNVSKLKHIILQSKRPRYLFLLAQRTKNKQDLQHIQDLIIEANSPTYARLFACKIKGANIERLEDFVIRSMDVNEIKKFAMALNTERATRMALIC